jgi:hypothetical protein
LSQPNKTRKKAGRPKLPKGEAMGRAIQVRFTVGDLKSFAAAARMKNMTVSEWVRTSLTERNVPVWYGLCADDSRHIILFDNEPLPAAFCPLCRVTRKVFGVERGYVSKAEADKGWNDLLPLSNPESTPLRTRF